VAAAVGCLLFVVAGCGSSSSSSSTSATSNPGKGATGSPVKVGIIAPEGAPAFNQEGIVEAVRAGVLALDERGGLEGHEVQVVYCNDKGDPNTTAACAQKMVSEEVIAMTGGTALNGNVIPPILEKANISIIGNNALTGPEYNAPNEYFFTIGSTGAFNVLAAYIGHEKIPTSIFASSNPTGDALRKGIEATAEEAGMPFVTAVPITAEQAEFASVIAAAKPEEAEDGLWFIGNAQIVQTVEAAKAAGAEFKWIGPDTETPSKEVVEALGGTVSNLTLATPFPPLTPESSNATIKRYFEEMKRASEGGEPKASKPGEYPNSVDFSSWLAVQLLEQFVKEGQIKSLTADGVTAALKKAENVNVAGVLKDWSPNKPGPPGLSRGSNTAYNIIEYQDGKPKELTSHPVTPQEIIEGKVTFK